MLSHVSNNFLNFFFLRSHNIAQFLDTYYFIRIIAEITCIYHISKKPSLILIHDRYLNHFHLLCRYLLLILDLIFAIAMRINFPCHLTVIRYFPLMTSLCVCIVLEHWLLSLCCLKEMLIWDMVLTGKCIIKERLMTCSGKRYEPFYPTEK